MYTIRVLLVLLSTIVTTTPLASRAAPSIAGTWTVTGSMHQARAFQTATLLPSGLVLVAGGCQSPCSTNVNLTSAELYHPHTGSWAGTGAMHDPRIQFTATLLHDGRVLVAGGCRTGDCAIVFASAELYNPRTGTWRLTGSLHEPRTFQTATLLPDGRVLVTGGATGCSSSTCSPILASAEIYDPRTGIWTRTASMRQARARATATLLPDGRVLVAGGAADGANNAYSNPLASAEIYDPQTNTWTVTGSMHQPRCGYTATLLHNGQVLIAGGYNNMFVLSAELYQPSTGIWTTTGAPPNRLDYETGETATLLPSGVVLVAGNVVDTVSTPLASAELYHPRTHRWTATGALSGGCAFQTTTLLLNGQVLVAGGSSTADDSTVLASAEIYQPQSGS